MTELGTSEQLMPCRVSACRNELLRKWTWLYFE